MTSEPKTVFIVEDEAFIQKTYVRRLREAGLETVTASDGEEAIQKVSDLSAHLVLLDLILPKQNGFDVLRALKSNEKTKDIPVLVLSNLGSDKDIRKAEELGAEKYFVKADTSIKKVMEAIREYIK